MAVKVDIARQRRGQFGPRGLGVPVLAARTALRCLRFAATDKAFVEHRLAIGAALDIDASALALGSVFILPTGEMLVWRDDHDIGPACFEIVGLARIDCGHLRCPEGIAVGEIAVLAKQIGNDLAGIGLKVEQRDTGRNRCAAKQPAFELTAARGIGLRILEQCQPCLLLRLAGERQMADGRGIHFLGAVGFADAGQEIAEREDALHLQFGEREGCGNILDAAAFLHEAGEAFPLGDLVGVLPQQVLDHRDFERFGIITLADDDARQAALLAAFLGSFDAREIAALACQYLEMVGLAICAHEQRREHAARLHRWQDIADIGGLAPAPHIDGGDRKTVQRDMVDLHDSDSLNNLLERVAPPSGRGAWEAEGGAGVSRIEGTGPMRASSAGWGYGGERLRPDSPARASAAAARVKWSGCSMIWPQNRAASA